MGCVYSKIDAIELGVVKTISLWIPNPKLGRAAGIVRHGRPTKRAPNLITFILLYSCFGYCSLLKFQFDTTGQLQYKVEKETS